MEFINFMIVLTLLLFTIYFLTFSNYQIFYKKISEIQDKE